MTGSPPTPTSPDGCCGGTSGHANSLDVGCATGYLVEVLRERGIDAEGCDVSQFAIDHAAPGAVGHVRVANLFAGLPWADGSFELVTALEILEHLPPDRVAAALAELQRVCGAYLYATIPSFGPNVSGPDGHFEGKVRPERVEHYRELGPDYPGPVPEPDLAVDAEGQLVEGHLTIASFEWWTLQFGLVGFTRCPDIERRLYADIEPGDLAPFWNIYVFRVDGAPDAMAEPRRPRPLAGRARARATRCSSDERPPASRRLRVLRRLRASPVRPAQPRGAARSPSTGRRCSTPPTSGCTASSPRSGRWSTPTTRWRCR